MIRRICFYSGPCCGKSVMAAKVFLELKKRNKTVELIQEYAKDLAYEGYQIKPYDQLKIFAEQISREYRVLKSSEDVVIVTDGPFALSIPYAQKYGFESWPSLVEISRKFELDFPSINFYLVRGDCPYSTVGRYENLDEAKMMDALITNFLDEHKIPLIFVNYDDPELVLRKIDLLLYQEPILLEKGIPITLPDLPKGAYPYLSYQYPPKEDSLV